MSDLGWLVVSVHDVAPPHWERVRAMLDVLDGVGVRRRSLLVIPNFKGRWPLDRQMSLCASLLDLQSGGDEIVLHGYEHGGVGTPRGLVDRFKNRWFTQNEGEFLSLDYRAASDRIGLGLRILRGVGLEARGFVAPAWLISRDGLRAARDCGLDYTNSYFGLQDLAHGWSRAAPSLVFGPGHLNEDLGIALQRRLSRWLSRCPIVRVALHPPCIDHQRRFEQIMTMIREQLTDHRPVTYFELLSHLRAMDEPLGCTADG